MNIGIFGHSIANWEHKEPWSFITKLQDHFNANIVNSGCAMCSEERILLQLKKIKKIDIAIIFHADPTVCFIPSWHRDATTAGREYLVEKFNLMKGATLEEIKKHPEIIDLIENWCNTKGVQFTDDEILFEINRIASTENAPVIAVLNSIAKEQNIKLDSDTLIKENPQESLMNLVKSYVDENIFFKELIDALMLHKKYLYHPDLQLNRYYGALLQIDQYLTSKQIPVIHCLGKDGWYPPWFKFTSGIVDKELATFHGGKPFKVSVKTPEGNDIMFKKLLDLIPAACSREVLR